MRDPELAQNLELDDGAFNQLRVLVKKRTGIDLSDAKKALVYGRLARRLRALGLDNFHRYVALVSDENHPEARELVNAITTNVTQFFRERHHFDFLAQKGWAELYRRNQKSKKLRIWSAACSTGEEPYSLAISALEHPVPEGWDLKILATDLDSQVLAVGAAGVYGTERLEGLGQARLQRWFEPGAEPQTHQVKVALERLVFWGQLNLLACWPMRGPFDVIFCRNVVIYFDQETKKTIFNRLREYLAPGGYLMLGHAESLLGVPGYEPIGRTIYRRLP